MSSDEFPELQEFEFNLKSAKNTKTSQKKADKQNQFQSQKIKKNKELKQLNTIQEMNFKYIWNFLKERQDSTVIKAKDIARAAQGVLKKPIDEALIQEMLSINNEQDSLKEEELRQIFMECKLKM